MRQFIDVPELIETERLALAKPSLDKLEELFEAIQESMDDILPWLPWARRDMTILDSETYIRQANANFALQQSFSYLILDKSTRRYIGGVGFPRLDWSIPRFEIGYWCRVSEQGHGYVTEATVALIELAFVKLGARRVEICCDEENVRSRAIPEKLGFPLEGCLKNVIRTASGEIKNNCIYAATSLDQLSI